MHRFSLPALSNTARRVGAVLVSCLAVVTLASCGGGTQAKKFVPDSLVVFGDEQSLVKADGSRYTINATTTTTGAYSCTLGVSWIMYFANNFGFLFNDRCVDWNSTSAKTAIMRANDPMDVSFNVSDATSVNTAVANAGANAVLTTINQNLGLLNDKTLVTITVGRADIVQAYWTYLQTPTDATLSSLESQLKTLGGAFAAGIRPVIRSGARVMVVLTPSLEESPLAKQDAANLARNKAAIKALAGAFNDGLTFALYTNGYTGQQVALVDVPRLFSSIATTYTAYGLTNVDGTACATPASGAPLCLTGALSATDAATSYLWVDATHLNTSVAGLISTAAYNAFHSHPF